MSWSRRSRATRGARRPSSTALVNRPQPDRQFSGLAPAHHLRVQPACELHRVGEPRDMPRRRWAGRPGRRLIPHVADAECVGEHLEERPLVTPHVHRHARVRRTERERSLRAQQAVEIRTQRIAALGARQDLGGRWPIEPAVGEALPQSAHRKRAVADARVPPVHGIAPDPDLAPAAASDREAAKKLGKRAAVGLGLPRHSTWGFDVRRAGTGRVKPMPVASRSQSTSAASSSRRRSDMKHPYDCPPLASVIPKCASPSRKPAMKCPSASQRRFTCKSYLSKRRIYALSDS
jgi:hypothetical protein